HGGLGEPSVEAGQHHVVLMEDVHPFASGAVDAGIPVADVPDVFGLAVQLDRIAADLADQRLDVHGRRSVVDDGDLGHAPTLGHAADLEIQPATILLGGGAVHDEGGLLAARAVVPGWHHRDVVVGVADELFGTRAPDRPGAGVVDHAVTVFGDGRAHHLGPR